MATLVLSAAGTLVGGPLGGAIGALVGRQIDGAIFGSGSRTGPRLKELSVTTSSYGQPIPRLFGSVRVPGTIIWATDLKESKETRGGGKGKPKTTSYSYSISFAVAVSSRPIRSVGRIWADGNLLRGSSGDLKVGGTMRVYDGYGDQPPDPLIAADKGVQCPAFRDCAYIVFEDLQLGDFGNRIPALTFELFADEVDRVELAQIVPHSEAVEALGELEYLEGYTNDGVAPTVLLDELKEVYPISCALINGKLRLSNGYSIASNIRQLPDRILESDPQSRRRLAAHRKLPASDNPVPKALRYYDRARDYQPSVQRAVGMAAQGRETMFELPASLQANNARTLCNRMARTSRWRAETIGWTVAELDPQIGPGTIVTVPGHPGFWQVVAWEWNDRGIEYALARIPPESLDPVPADTGETIPPVDTPLGPTILRAFELPWDGAGDPAVPLYSAALSSAQGSGGASLYIEQASALNPIGTVPSRRSHIGTLQSSLSPSRCRFLEPSASAEIEFTDDRAILLSASVEELAAGANKILIGEEILQFAVAEKISARRWRITGLLRGRGATEDRAADGHPVGADVILLDEDLYALDPSFIPGSGPARIAAISLGDPAPVYADLTNRGRSRQPLSPVHCRALRTQSGDISLSWVRRGRGQWRWEDHVDTALVEEQELYEVGFGPVNLPHASWQVGEPSLLVPKAQSDLLLQQFGSDILWVRQLGTFGRSPASFLTTLI